MPAVFTIIPLVLLVALDAAAITGWTRRRSLLTSGSPATAHIMRIDVIVTEHVSPPDDTNARATSKSTKIRPVVRFTAADGQVITTSPMRRQADKNLVAGDEVKVRYNPTKPTRCIVDKPEDKNKGIAATVLFLTMMNVLLIAFAIVAFGANKAAPAPTVPTFTVPGRAVGSGWLGR